MTGFSFSDVALSPDGQRLAYGLDDGTGGIYGYPTADGEGPAEEYSDPRRPDREVNTIAFSPDGERVVDADDDGTARIYFSGNPWLASVDDADRACAATCTTIRPASSAWQHDDLVGIVDSGNDTIVKTVVISQRPLAAGLRPPLLRWCGQRVQHSVPTVAWPQSGTDQVVRTRR